MLVADEADALTPVTSPSLISKTRSTRPWSSWMILGSTDGVVAAAAAIDGQDALDVGLHARAGEDLARLGLHLVAQLVVLDLAVTLEGDAIDDRVLGHLHDQGRALHVDHDVREQAGREQRLQRAVGRRRIVGLAFLELKIGADRLGFGADVALDLDGGDRATAGAPAPAPPRWACGRAHRIARTAAMARTAQRKFNLTPGTFQTCRPVSGAPAS